MNWRFCVVTAALAGRIVLAQSTAQQPGHPDHMEHHFDPEASAKAFDDPARDAWQMPDRVISTLALRAGQVVADIGSGTGYFTVRLAKSAAAPKVYGADIEPEMVKYLQPDPVHRRERAQGVAVGECSTRHSVRYRLASEIDDDITSRL